MNPDLKIIKKKYGEKMMHLCRELFPSILEQEGILSKLMLEHFHPSHELYNDILEASLFDEFKSYIYSFLDVEKDEKVVINKSPEELLSDVGYNLIHCKTVQDVEQFKKYYAKGEELCTFKNILGRLNRFHIFFAVKKDVDQIKREDFLKPTRQDLYGTSVMSIQFSKDYDNTLSIKNRYNHTVNNPDATFSNNLDNITYGLTEAFNNKYGIYPQNSKNGFELPSYVQASDGKFYKYNYEINNIYYCTDNIIIDNFMVKKYDKEKYLIFDYFILDIQNKKMYLYDQSIEDSFVSSNGIITKIVIQKTNDYKEIIINSSKGEYVIIILDSQNRIIAYRNNNVKKIGNRFLYYNVILQNINLAGLEETGNHFLCWNLALEELDLTSLKKVGNDFLFHNIKLKRLNVPNLEETGNDFLNCNQELEELECLSLKKTGTTFLAANEVLKRIIVPNLEEVSNSFLFFNKELEELDCPKLRKVGTSFLLDNKILKRISVPNLEEVKANFLGFNEELEELDCPQLNDLGFALSEPLSKKQLKRGKTKKRVIKLS